MQDSKFDKTEITNDYDLVYEYKINVKPGQKRKFICIDETSLY